MSVQPMSVSNSGRSVSIQITNQTDNFILQNPKVWNYSGYADTPPPPQINPGQNGACSFDKTSGSLWGSAGVMTYELYNERKNSSTVMLAIMFSVPQDTAYSNWFAVGVFDVDRDCDKDLYNDMYYNDENGFLRRQAGTQINYEGLVATMSADVNSILTLTATFLEPESDE